MREMVFHQINNLLMPFFNKVHDIYVSFRTLVFRNNNNQKRNCHAKGYNY